MDLNKSRKSTPVITTLTLQLGTRKNISKSFTYFVLFERNITFTAASIISLCLQGLWKIILSSQNLFS